MNDPDFSRCIRDAGGRVTAARLAVLRCLAAAEEPLTPDEVLEHLTQTPGHVPDRVTIYRAIDWLSAHGLVRRLATVGRAARYEPVEDREAHAHFQCRRCGQTRCLPAPSPTLPTLPPGYVAERVELVIHGLCAACRAGENA